MLAKETGRSRGRKRSNVQRTEREWERKMVDNGIRGGQGPDQLGPVGNYVPCFYFVLSPLKRRISRELRIMEV